MPARHLAGIRMPKSGCAKGLAAGGKCAGAHVRQEPKMKERKVSVVGAGPVSSPLAGALGADGVDERGPGRGAPWVFIGSTDSRWQQCPLSFLLACCTRNQRMQEPRITSPSAEGPETAVTLTGSEFSLQQPCSLESLFRWCCLHLCRASGGRCLVPCWRRRHLEAFST